MSEIDRIQRIVQPIQAPTPSHRVTGADWRSDGHQPKQQEDTLELHEEGDAAPEAILEEVPEAPDVPSEGLDIAI